MSMTRILYASDFHGSDAFWRKFISAAFQYQANVLIVGGDITGKAMVPVVHQGGGRYLAFLFGRREEPGSPQALQKLTQTISNVGFYPILLEKDEAAALEADAEQMGRRFEKEMSDRIRAWLTLAEEKLKPKQISLYFMAGNDDLPAMDAVIAEFLWVKNPDGRCFKLDADHELVGISNANMTPWACPRDIEETEMETRLEELAGLLQDPGRAICTLHVPPFDAGIDVCPELDKDLKIVAMGGQVIMKPVGSKAVRKFIEKTQPMLTLHGHIHEAPGHVRIGKTLCINAGSEYAEGIMKAAIINVERDKVKGHLLVSG
jgi:Icc-related predicted phosphoesterase